MATGGEVHGQCPGRSGSEDLNELKCQPCLEDGDLRQAVGMCVDCQDYLCVKCFEGHTLPKPMRKHRLLDSEQMLQSDIKPNPKDACTERCPAHQDEILQYYCLDHYQLGCPVCITEDHNTCTKVQYIPRVTRELANNTEYRQVDSELRAALEAFKKASENTKQNAEEVNTSCTTALECVKKYRKQVEEAFDNIEARLIEKAQEMKAKDLKELQAINDKYTKVHKELQASLTKIEALQSTKQNCSSYTEMMRTKDKLKSLDAEIKEAVVDKTYRQRQIQFTSNNAILDTLKDPDVLGTLSGTEAGVNSYNGNIVGATHFKDVNVKSGSDTKGCYISGLVVLPDGKLVVVDNYNNKIKIVSVEDGQVKEQLNMSSGPWDITVISKDKLAVTMPGDKKIAFVSMDDKNMRVDRKLNVSGSCWGIAYRNDKLAVAMQYSNTVQILDMQGTILDTISTDKQGRPIFSDPLYLSYCQDDTVYVSNHFAHHVVCVKLNGTVVATSTDGDLKSPCEPVSDSSGNVYVCAYDTDTVHQISKNCKKLRVLLTKTDGLTSPMSMCLREETDMLYVGMGGNNVKVYKLERSSQ